ncbi:MAG: Panacea domain-containing protein [Saprospiraceae bacterium]
MNKNFSYNKDKAIAAIVFVLREMDGSVNLHKLSKILYFADQKHLIEFGRPIIGDNYQAMQYGPVPHATYNIVRNEVNPEFSRQGGYNLLLEEYEETIFEELSATDMEFLSDSVIDNKDLTFQQLIDKSHKYAWTKNEGKFMDVLDIATEAGADSDMLKYISHNIENQNFAS